jgi:hypothetical protein
MSDFTIWICPICREQVSDDPEYGAGCYHSEYGGDVDAVQVRVQPFTASIESEIADAQQRLKDQKRRYETREAFWDWWRSQPKEWRDEQEAIRRSNMHPMALAMEDAVKAMCAESAALLSRQPVWAGSIHHPDPATGQTLMTKTVERR